MAWTDEARAAAAATRKAKAKHPAKGAKVAKALKTDKQVLSGAKSLLAAINMSALTSVKPKGPRVFIRPSQTSSFRARKK